MKHEEIDRRSLAMARVIARRLREKPELLSTARGNLVRWIASGSPGSRPALIEWLRIIDNGIDAVLPVLIGEDENSTRLRQSSPFAGEQFITREERTAILLKFREL